jgi:GTP-binding protein
VEPEAIPETCEDLKINEEDGVWTVEGAWMERLIDRINFSDSESRMYFDRVLRTSGLFERLEAMGIEEGDTVSIYSLEFEYKK